MGLFFGGVPTWLVEWSRTLGLDAAVETGTFRGDSADLLARSFGHCTTIELEPELARLAQERFAGRSDVSVLEGTSRLLLEQVLQRPSFVWLDAHYSAAATAGADDPCPLLAELDVISKSGHEHVVAIDDQRVFGVPAPGWPSIPDILGRLSGTVFLVDDVIVAVPEASAASFPRSGFRQDTLLFSIWNEVQRASLRQRSLPARIRRRRLELFGSRG